MTEETELQALRRRVARLEDIEAIRALKVLYGRYCDPTHNLDGMMALFTKDAVFDIGEEYGSYSGHDEIRAFLEGADDIMLWAIHYMIAPQIELGRRRAVRPTAPGICGNWAPCRTRTATAGNPSGSPASITTTWSRSTANGVSARWR